MIVRDFYRLPELAAKWGCTTDDVLHLAETGRLRLAVRLYVPQGAGKVRVTVAELSGRHKIETLPLDVMLDQHKGLFWLCLDEVITLVATGKVDISRAYTLDDDLVLFEWPPGTGFRVTTDNVVVLSRDAEVAREAFSQDARKPKESSAPLSPRAEATYLTIIGALLELVLGKTPGGKPQSVFASQAAIIDVLVAHHGDKSGISKSTLEAKFADARRQLGST